MRHSVGPRLNNNWPQSLVFSGDFSKFQPPARLDPFTHVSHRNVSKFLFQDSDHWASSSFLVNSASHVQSLDNSKTTLQTHDQNGAFQNFNNGTHSWLWLPVNQTIQAQGPTAQTTGKKNAVREYPARPRCSRFLLCSQNSCSFLSLHFARCCVGIPSDSSAASLCHFE